jgi:hypothetical protein
MKIFGSHAVVLSFLLAIGPLARAQAGPAVSDDAQVRASLNAQAKARLDEDLLPVLQGRPGVAITGIIYVTGATTKLTSESVQETAELALRRNGIPVVSSCEIGANCGRLIAAIRATCTDLTPRDAAGGPTGVCAAYIRVEYQEIVRSTRPNATPVNVPGEMWFEDSVGLLTNPFQEESARKQLTEAVEKFALSYLRSNPAK